MAGSERELKQMLDNAVIGSKKGLTINYKEKMYCQLKETAQGVGYISGISTSSKCRNFTIRVV